MKTVDDIYGALRKRFAAPEYALLFEVANATGHAANNYCDAIAMSLWPSRGLTLHGMEIKVSRGDWLRELKRPDKAEGHAGRCDLWSLIVANADIVQPLELPVGWGLGIVERGSVRFAVEPAKRESPRLIERGFLAALLRSADRADGVQARIDAAILEARTNLEDGISAKIEARAAARNRELEQLRKNVKEFEDAAGVELSNYRGGDIGRAVRVILEKGDDYVFDQARNLRDRLDALLKP